MSAMSSICLLSLITLVTSISVSPVKPVNLKTFARDEDLDYGGFGSTNVKPEQCETSPRTSGQKVCDPRVEFMRLIVARGNGLKHGEQAIVQCKVKASSDKVRIAWFFENERLRLTNNKTTRKFRIDDRRQEGEILSSLYINGAIKEDGGRYRCKASQ
uniref:Ig-like domain-containing protein n=1 Tax=Romanomermis culicivorax TaxID=13658 RepID=A0A915IWF6_ROMCU